MQIKKKANSDVDLKVYDGKIDPGPYISLVASLKKIAHGG